MILWLDYLKRKLEVHLRSTYRHCNGVACEEGRVLLGEVFFGHIQQGLKCSKSCCVLLFGEGLPAGTRTS